jgi:hypothetical protein
MTMYLSNADVHPIGFEPGEFLEPPIIALREPSNAAEVDHDDATRTES